MISTPRNINARRYISGIHILAAAGDRRIPYYYCTENSAEIDLVFKRDGTVEMAIDIKGSTSPTLSRGFNLAHDTLKPREGEWVGSLSAFDVYRYTTSGPTVSCDWLACA